MSKTPRHRARDAAQSPRQGNNAFRQQNTPQGRRTASAAPDAEGAGYRDRKPSEPRRQANRDGQEAPFASTGYRDRKPNEQRRQANRDGQEAPFASTGFRDRNATGNKPPQNGGSKPFAGGRGRPYPAKTRSADGETRPRPAPDYQERQERNAAPAKPAFSRHPEAGPRPNQASNRPAEGSYVAVQRAKKLALRAPSHKEQLRIERLKDLRVKPEDLPAMRLQKAMALAGLGSRRAMEELIQAGRVTINHRPAQLGDRVSPDDKVRLDGKPVFIRWPDRLPRIVIYHKQEGELVTRDDPEGRVTVFDRLPQAHSSRWVAVGRLDLNTSGLLVMTTSGELANRMMHPSFEVEREYAVRVLGELTDELKKSLLAGIELEDGTAKFDRLIDQGGEGANHWYRVIIREGRNREVRRLFEAVGLTVSRLIRVRFGALTLPPRLKRGQFYELNASEAAQVMKWAGLDVNGLARE